ncbi:MAG TPA: tetratricopeptide repeat protein [Candidatus Binatia bacterium]|nr:tetratricopeptide repeat protein [Candidatus Binatia bacterium]
MSTNDKKTTALALPEASPDTETILLERLKNSTTDEDYFRWMLFVVGFYRGINKLDAASELLQGFLKTSKDVEYSAHCYLALGQIATDEQRFEIALKYFTSALELAPKKRKVLYVLHNNIAFCLNRLGRFEEGEKHCRKAIDIDWTRASAYRNLGVSLEGRKDLVGAAWALAEAIKADPADNRARLILEKLIEAQPALVTQCPWTHEVLSADGKSTPDTLLM